MAGGMTGSKEAARSAEPRVVDGNVPRHAPMEPPDQGVGPGSRPLPQLVGDLTMSVWGLAALASADETGLLDELGEPGSAQALAQRTGLPAPLVESLMDVLVALGLVMVLLVSGLIEAFVTPSPLPTALRVAIGVLAWLGFLGYVVVLGWRARQESVTTDLAAELNEDVRPAV